MSTSGTRGAARLGTSQLLPTSLGCEHDLKTAAENLGFVAPQRHGRSTAAIHLVATRTPVWPPATELDEKSRRHRTEGSSAESRLPLATHAFWCGSPRNQEGATL